jgi:hypothetical protein
MVDYNNSLLTSGTAILVYIRDCLLLSGWIAITDDITNNNFLKVKGIASNNDECWIEFDLGTYSSLSTIRIRGDLDGTNTHYSNYFYCQYLENNNNQIYITSSSDAMGLFILSSGMSSGNYGSAGSGIHCGFLNRFIDYANDPYAWMVGYIYSFPWVRQIAKSAYNATIWQQHCNSNLSDTYALFDHLQNGISNFGSTACSPMLGTIDRFIGSDTLRTASWVSPITSNTYSTSNFCQHGGVNPLNDLPVLDTMYISEGANITGYGDDGTGLNKGFYYRGEIKFCYVGGSSLPVGTIVEDRNGSQYISTGNEGWQMLKIS